MAPVLSLWGLIGLMACKEDSIDLKESADIVDTATDTATDTADTGATGDDTGATGDDTGAPDRAPEAGCSVKKTTRYTNVPGTTTEWVRYDDKARVIGRSYGTWEGGVYQQDYNRYDDHDSLVLNETRSIFNGQTFAQRTAYPHRYEGDRTVWEALDYNEDAVYEQETTWNWDADGRFRDGQQVAGQQITLLTETFDAQGHRTQATSDFGDNGSVEQSTVWQYDGDLLTGIDVTTGRFTARTLYTYDAAGLLTGQTEDYDGDGRPETEITYQNGIDDRPVRTTTRSNGRISGVVLMRYDEAGRLFREAWISPGMGDEPYYRFSYEWTCPDR